jgi:hypothetical protein
MHRAGSPLQLERRLHNLIMYVKSSKTQKKKKKKNTVIPMGELKLSMFERSREPQA